MTLNRIYIIIPVHNRIHFTRNCLLSLKKQTFQNFTTIVVDDGSIDGTGEMIKGEFPDVILLKGDGNLWWTGATNVGIRRVLAEAGHDDFILLLNDDLVVDEFYLAMFRDASEKLPGSIIGSVEVFINTPDIIRSGGVIINRLSAKNIILNKGKKLSYFDKDYFVEVSTLPGRGTLYPVSVFKNVGLFDDRYFKQCGDTELPLRARLTGIRLFVYYGAVVKSLEQKENINNINLKEKYAVTDIKKYYFDIRSNFRIKYRWHFSRSISKKSFICFYFFIFDFFRITMHFFCNFKFSNKNI